jgi:hypothetical protein
MAKTPTVLSGPVRQPGGWLAGQGTRPTADRRRADAPVRVRPPGRTVSYVRITTARTRDFFERLFGL